MRQLVHLALVLCCLSGSAVSWLPAAARQGDEPHVLRVNTGDFWWDTYDPQMYHSGQSFVLVDFEGLTRIDEDLHAVPGAAESWEFSPDGKTITFHLRDGLVFSDGTPIVAEHFRYAAERICGPELDSKSAQQLFGVVGCQALFTSEDETAAAAARASLGVRAIDDRTIEYRFDKPAPYFPVTAASWSAFPLRQDLIAAGGPEWWADPATRVGNGPFQLVEYDAEGADKHLTFARNDNYWRGQAKLDRIEFPFVDYNDPATLEAYRDGEFDVDWVRQDTMPAIEADPVLSREVVVFPILGTEIFAFSLHREPFTDQKVREAFSYAFDRDAYCIELNWGGSNCRPTLSWVPPGMPGHIETDAFAFDPEKAREALAASSYGGPENLPEITWYGWKSDDPRDVYWPEWLREQFRQVLGVELKIVYLTDKEHDAQFDDEATIPQMHESVWWGNPDPRDWFIVWRCDSEFNDDGYCNPELDALVDQADAELDPERRIALYEEAGQMLVADAPAIFALTATNTMLVKPSVVGYSRTTPNGNWPGWTDMLTVDIVPAA